MCDLCGTEEEREKGRRRAAYMAEQLDRLSSTYRAMANGRFKPHGDDGKNTLPLATLVIRELVAEWI